MIKRILVPIDGSKHADNALEYAINIAEKYNATVVLLSIIPPIPVISYGNVTSPPVWMGTYFKEMEAMYEKVLSDALEKVKRSKPSLKVSKKLMEGSPADKIIETAKEGNFDMIVMGSRGLGGIKELFLGSVSDKVADDAECPVLIVK